MANFYDFSSDNINIFLLLIDNSLSMEDDEENVKKGLKLYQKSFKNFPEANSISVSISKFNSDFYPTDFEQINELDTRYITNGATALYYSIVQGAKHLKNYISEVTRIKKCIPRATFVVFSDGEPWNDKMNQEDAEKAIEELNYAGITTVFVAFGKAIDSKFGKDLGFMSTIDVNNRETLINFLGVELSKSCKEQSQSLKALGANFFSQAVNNGNSEGYSQTAAQALEDDSWINDI